MKNQSKFRLLTLVGVFAILSVSLSSCFYGGYGYRDRYYSRPSYGYGYRSYSRPQVRVYSAPPRRYSHHDNYRSYNNRNHDSYRGNSRYGRR
ncbi:hypothetical protein EMA8858_00710 [Emticicia aquatica]|uniref:Lipoprotein n=1 Tax=Emticicia aquatica TaxID=1681835 RepID=A0ABM9AMV3_9BACT|nr:hypothetical protein [Emticicia aquatica]CAH0994600.1 hypothetical protein EMA8858_00710 [Emticicia aquatica]